MPVSGDGFMINAGQRIKMETCIHPETYQYYLANQQTANIWSRLEDCYGKIQRNAFNVMWIESKTFLFKAPLTGSPLTVLRKRHCCSSDVKFFHQLIEFNEVTQGNRISM